MDAATRKAKLLEIKSDETANVVMTGIPLRYRGQTRTEKVYRIPLSFLIYNKYNGRIGMEVQSFEAQSGELNPENEHDIKKIEEFLFESKKDRNVKTMDSLLHNGQQRYGIVSADGKIVDGNRRAMLLNKLFNERDEMHLKITEVDHCQYFLAIILPDDATEKDMQQLETIYQMGEDDKVDYDAIQKYLKCKELRKHFTVNDIANFMGEKESQITQWLAILQLMEEYLDTYGYQEIYTRLERTEGQFVDLQGYLETYTKTARHVDWAYNDTDISDLKMVCFDYIRARYEGKEFRDIAKTGKDGSIFAYQDIWKDFLQEHIEKIPKDELSTEEYRQQHPGDDISRLLRSRDEDWRGKAKGLLEGNLRKNTRKVEDKSDSNKPLQLLERAISTLESVDTTLPSFRTDERILEYVKRIGSISWEMKKLLEKR